MICVYAGRTDAFEPAYCATELHVPSAQPIFASVFTDAIGAPFC